MSQMNDYEKKMIEMQFQMRENQAYMQDMFVDLENWTKDIKEKEKKVLENPDSIKNSNKGLPPIRAIVANKKKKKKNTKTTPNEEKKTKKLSRYDYRAWDKVDVDKMCEEIDSKQTSSSEYTTDEEWEEEQRKIKAEWEKERGNQFFKDNMLNEAINCYTNAIQLEPNNAIYVANRAMCLLKQEKYAAAEVDCSLSIELDSKYVKAYHRRATARYKLGKFDEAKKDYEKLLELEPNNKLAQSELAKLEQLIESKNIIFPVLKKEEEKSIKPLRRIFIEEINEEDYTRADLKKIPEKINNKEILKEKENLLQVDEFKEIENKIKEINLNEKLDQELVKVELKKTIPKNSPNNAYQFKKDWQLLNNDIQLLAEYFKIIKPEEYQKLFLNGLDSDDLSKILHIFNEYFLNDDKIDILKCMKCLSQVNRFQTQLMFITPKDKEAVESLLNHLKSKSDVIDKNELNNLEKIYKF